MPLANSTAVSVAHITASLSGLSIFSSAPKRGISSAVRRVELSSQKRFPSNPSAKAQPWPPLKNSPAEHKVPNAAARHIRPQPRVRETVSKAAPPRQVNRRNQKNAGKKTQPVLEPTLAQQNTSSFVRGRHPRNAVHDNPDRIRPEPSLVEELDAQIGVDCKTLAEDLLKNMKEVLKERHRRPCLKYNQQIDMFHDLRLDSLGQEHATQNDLPDKVPATGCDKSQHLEAQHRKLRMLAQRHSRQAGGKDEAFFAYAFGEVDAEVAKMEDERVLARLNTVSLFSEYEELRFACKDRFHFTQYVPKKANPKHSNLRDLARATNQLDRDNARLWRTPADSSQRGVLPARHRHKKGNKNKNKDKDFGKVDMPLEVGKPVLRMRWGR